MIALLLAAQAATTLDSFDTPGRWKAQGSDGVIATASEQGGALRLGYDFGKVSGYAFVARSLAIDWAADYEVTLRVRGTGGLNDLQLKFTDASGANVWWFQRRNFRPSEEWQTLRIRKRDIEFAWGPTADKVLRHSDRVELVVVRGRDGGAGTIEIDDLRYVVLPPPTPLPPPRASDPRAIDRDPRTAWIGKGGEGWRIDFGGRQSLGGLTLRWEGAAPRYAIETSDDGKRWAGVRTVDGGDGGDDPIALADLETRWLRVMLPRGAKAARLAELVVEPPEWGRRRTRSSPRWPRPRRVAPFRAASPNSPIGRWSGRMAARHRD
ncbi:discoidin domain-containing protein [uncultured Sphingomonas sp.]|uniref:discoidin domain-containing protein n=1 Tax=uncultured Sphingomonas sp. TaxID=158754 RepID=UPI0035C99FB9